MLKGRLGSCQIYEGFQKKENRVIDLKMEFSRLIKRSCSENHFHLVIR